jgi:8-hydroxy-5-deazaflavin:NADPH oxidoreductase
MPSLRIAILGAGVLGGTLGRKWTKAGHSVAFGVQNPSSIRAQRLRAELGDHLLIGSPAQALANSDIVLLAVPGSVVDQVITTHAQLLDHKLIIDATNKVQTADEATPAQHVETRSLNSLVTLQAHTPNARIYRALNSYCWESLADPLYQGVQADLIYCGPGCDAQGARLAAAAPSLEDQAARPAADQALVEQLIAEAGLRPMRLGDVDQISVVDHILWLWFALATAYKDHSVALKVLTH